MNYNWYKIFNLTEWLATGLTSRTVKAFLDGKGEKEFLITQGNETGVTVDEVFLTVKLEGKNPYTRDGMAVFVDANQDVWVGYEVSA